MHLVKFLSTTYRNDACSVCYYYDRYYCQQCDATAKPEKKYKVVTQVMQEVDISSVITFCLCWAASRCECV